MWGLKAPADASEAAGGTGGGGVGDGLLRADHLALDRLSQHRPLHVLRPDGSAVLERATRGAKNGGGCSMAVAVAVKVVVEVEKEGIR